MGVDWDNADSGSQSSCCPADLSFPSYRTSLLSEFPEKHQKNSANATNSGKRRSCRLCFGWKLNCGSYVDRKCPPQRRDELQEDTWVKALLPPITLNHLLLQWRHHNLQIPFFCESSWEWNYFQSFTECRKNCDSMRRRSRRIVKLTKTAAVRVRFGELEVAYHRFPLFSPTSLTKQTQSCKSEEGKKAFKSSSRSGKQQLKDPHWNGLSISEEDGRKCTWERAKAWDFFASEYMSACT